MAASNDSKTLDKLLLDQDTNDHFIRGLMSSVVLSTQKSNDLSSATFYEYANDISTCRKHINHILKDISVFIDRKGSKDKIQNFDHNSNTIFNNSNSNNNIISNIEKINFSDDMIDSSIYEYVIDLVDKLLEDADLKCDHLTMKKVFDHNMSEEMKLSHIASEVSMSMAVDKDRILQQQILDIEKPQIQFLEDIDNSRERPFKPRLTYKPYAMVSLDINEKIRNVNHFDTSYNEYVTPTGYYSHPYEEELKKLEYLSCQLEEPPMVESMKWAPLDSNKIVITDTLQQLESNIDELSCCDEVAIDLEHHSLRSFQGFTCLIQISSREKDYIIDAIKLRKSLQILNRITANPKIIKVFHGCTSDIVWLQKDFGVYVVNCFDTYQAAKLLKYPALSLSHLLKICCNVNANKRYQLADWRIRPLPADMIKYAVSDTHYLLHIYDRLRQEVWSAKQKEGLEFVLNASRKSCLQRYEKEFFWPLGYRKLLDNPRGQGMVKSQNLTAIQEAVLAKLWDWRDTMARELDESCLYVMSNAELLRIGTFTPRSITQLEKCGPLSHYVQIYKNDIVAIICEQYSSAPVSFSVAGNSIGSAFANADEGVSIEERLSNDTGGVDDIHVEIKDDNEKLYGRALPTPSRVEFDPSTLMDSEPTSPIPLPYQPYNQPNILSFTPQVSNSPQLGQSKHHQSQQRHQMTSPVLHLDEVFNDAKWNTSSSETRGSSRLDRDESEYRLKLMQAKQSIDNASRSLFASVTNIPTSAHVRGSGQIPSPPANSDSKQSKDVNTIGASEATLSTMNARESLYDLLSRGSTTIANDVDATILSQLPGSFKDIYNISNDLRRKKFDKKRTKEVFEETFSQLSSSGVRLPSTSTKLASNNNFPSVAALLRDNSVMGSRLFDESIYSRIATDSSLQSMIQPEKDIESTLDLAETLGWISDGHEREDIRKQHMLDAMTQQPDVDNDSNPHSTYNNTMTALRRGSDGKEPGRPWSSPGSPLKSSSNVVSTVQPSASDVPAKTTDYSKYTAMGALPSQNTSQPQPRAHSGSHRRSNSGSNLTSSGNTYTTGRGGRDGNRSYQGGTSPGSSTSMSFNPYFQGNNRKK